MSDFISREVLVHGLMEDYEKCMSFDGLLKYIHEQPTAYDMDKVVEKIERYKKIMKSNMESSGHDGMSAEYYRGRMNACADFLEIVKGGGQGE